MSAQPRIYLDVDAYLARERNGAVKHEYYAGEAFALGGSSQAHNIITANVIASLHIQLRQRQCTVYPSDLRVKVPSLGLYTYPDISVVCGPEQFEDAHSDTLLNPTLLVEVLSPSTERYDRGKKFRNYRNIVSFVEYLLIAQDARQIEQYRRQGDVWLFDVYTTPTDIMQLSSIGCTLALSDVYEKVVLDVEA